MTNAADRRPFSMPYVATATFTSGAMIARAPWPSPVNKYFVLRKLVISFSSTSTVGVSGGLLNIWDQDTSNTTPVGRGSGGGPLLSIPIAPVLVSGLSNAAPASMTILDIDACPQQYFQAGISAAANSQVNVSGSFNVTVEVDVV